MDVQALNTIRCNFTATLDMCNAFFPLLRPHARVVNVASRLGLLNKIIDSDLKAKLSNPNATIEDIVDVMNQYVE